MKTWTQDEIDADMDDGECPYCGGEGVIEGECTCGDDTCCCLVPDPPPCSHCQPRAAASRTTD